MSRYLTPLMLLTAVCSLCSAQSVTSRERDRAEYYVKAYAQHYGIPLVFVRSIVQQESAWHPCTISPKGAVGLMQLMPQTASRLRVTNRCDMSQNVSGGVRYIAWLMRVFHGDLRLVAAAYYAGEQVVARRGLNYRNRDVVNYVARLREIYRRSINENTPAARLSVGKDE